MYKNFKQFVYHKLLPFFKIIKYFKWLAYLRFQKDICLIIGAGPTKYKKWFATDIDTLDVTKETDFKKSFQKKKINKILAEHVLEHLTDTEIGKMLKNIYQYSNQNLIFRVAVPDGYHAELDYINTVKPGGTGEGADDHKHLFNYQTLSKTFEKSGYTAEPIEYWDENGQFHSTYEDSNGYIRRSFKNDKRNKDGKPHYTSLIIDFYKS